MKKLNPLFLSVLICLSLVACGQGNTSKKRTTQDPPPGSYHDPQECRTKNLYGLGIKGNSACPYKGDYDSQKGYQGVSVSFSSKINFSLGIGYRLDFGWDNDWEGVCPEPGQIPVFIGGRFNHCDQANPTYSDPDDGTNTHSCAGSQYNPGLTRCTPYNTRPTGDNNLRYID